MFDEVIDFKYAAIHGRNRPDKYFAKNYLVIDNLACNCNPCRRKIEEMGFDEEFVEKSEISEGEGLNFILFSPGIFK